MNAVLVVGLVLAATLTASAQESPAPPQWAEEVAESIWKGLEAVPWDGPLEANREASNVAWERFQGDGSAQWADEEWCERYTLESKTHTEEFYSYALPAHEAGMDQLRTPGVVTPGVAAMAVYCRIEQFRGSATGLTVAGLEVVQRALARRVSERFGAPEKPDQVHDFGAGSWHHLLRWETDELEIVVFIDEPRDRQPRLGVRARHRHLLEALADDEKLYSIQYDYSSRLGMRVEEALVETLKERLPSLSRLLGHEWPGVDEIATALLQLLESAPAEPTQQAPLLLAGDRLAERLQLGLDSDYPKWDELRAELGRHGLRYESDHLAYSWTYLHDLQTRVWQEHPETKWGEYAFVLLLRRGMTPSVACAEGSDTFRAVIQHGEEILRQRRESPRRLEVLFTVAQAYETWWSLSQASPEDGYARASDYQEGAEEARRKAAAYYEEVVGMAPNSNEALYAQRRLPRLRLGVDTNQRTFYCIYD